MASAPRLELVPRDPIASTLIGESRAMREVRALIELVAPTEASVLVTGPSGSGKELVARAIHAAGSRAAGCFSAMNCGAVPADLLEAELFGHERGAFTGAHALTRGRFEIADGGTLFLDEIGDMPAAMQVKLLRVLEERSVTRVGSRSPIAVDTRIVSATHRDIGGAIEQGSFREDLFYRLAVFPIHLPALAERIEDVPLLADHFLAAQPRARQFELTRLGIERLCEHGWAGNVRELRNVVERGCILYPGRDIGADEVGMLIELGRPGRRPTTLVAPAPAAEADEAVDLRSLLADVEHQHIRRALDQAGGVVADAARLLTLQRTTLIEKMQKHGLKRAV